jgi:hypothetical protein
MYFRAESGDKRPLCKKLYNWYRRRVTDYKSYLSVLFPEKKRVIAKVATSVYVITKRKRISTDVRGKPDTSINGAKGATVVQTFLRNFKEPYNVSLHYHNIISYKSKVK